jgi:tyrosyl-tRNA synthetase
MNFIEELRWRGMLQDIMPGTEELLSKEMSAAYIGFDPTADSLHVGSLVQIIILKHFQLAGHKPIVLVGGATGLIGDPSGKKEERKLLTEEEVDYNVTCIQQQLSKFLDFKTGENAALLVNNADWFKGITTIEFLRDAGKYLTVSYLLNKGFIKDRLAQEQDISFTEFNYILMQAYDFLWLYQHKNCKLQMGGSDQWGNITAGAELIRKKLRNDAFGLTCKLLTKADGAKFGKTETGNIWLDPAKTSPYLFYQFWLNASDEDAEKWIKIFTFLPKDEIDLILSEHKGNEHLRLLQKRLAEQVTKFVHGDGAFYQAKRASEFLFGNETDASFLQQIDETMFLNIFESVPLHLINKDKTVDNGINILDFLVETEILPSKGEARKLIQNGGLSINKGKVEDVEYSINYAKIIHEKYIVVQKGKKNYYLVKVF